MLRSPGAAAQYLAYQDGLRCAEESGHPDRKIQQKTPFIIKKDQHLEPCFWTRCSPLNKCFWYLQTPVENLWLHLLIAPTAFLLFCSDIQKRKRKTHLQLKQQDNEFAIKQEKANKETDSQLKPLQWPLLYSHIIYFKWQRINRVNSEWASVLRVTLILPWSHPLKILKHIWHRHFSDVIYGTVFALYWSWTIAYVW